MDCDAAVQTTSWTKTKEAIANFRQLLLCSKCTNLMKDPVCLGTCEHLLCRSCAAPSAGEGCVVCHSPAWVKDIYINRQLSSIIELFSDLEKLVNPTAQEDTTKQESPASNQKKNFKIWFSPRSRKIRCLVEKASESKPHGKMPGTNPSPTNMQSKDLSVFNFTSSSQDSGSSSPQTHNSSSRHKKQTKKSGQRRKKVPARARACPTQKETMHKMSRLQAINQQWGITEGPSALTDQPCTERPCRSGKRVSFGGPAVTSDKPHAQLPQGTTNEVNPGTATENILGTVSNDQALEPSSEIVGDFDQSGTLLSNEFKAELNPDKNEGIVCSPAAESLRRENLVVCDTTPKRPRVSPGKRRRPSAVRRTPCVLSSPSLSSPVCAKTTRSPRVELGDSPSSSMGSVSRKSPRLSSGSPAVLKRNHKGETALHIAAIKVTKL